MNKFRLGYLAAVLASVFAGCLDDRLAPELNFNVESAIELLVYLESHGDYINSEALNEFVPVSEVYANKSSYLIIDVRTQIEFANGHIENAVNVEPKNLLNYLKSINNSRYPKTVIVSESGQSAAYYTAMLRFAGYSNIVSMEYGMAAWHHDFAAIWLNAIRNFREGPDELNYFTNQEYPKPSHTNLPQLNFQNGNKSAKEKLDERILKLLAAGFNERLADSTISPKFAQSILDDGSPSVLVENVYSSFDETANSFTDYHIICFGNNFLYKAHSRDGPFAAQGHLPSAVLYLPLQDLRSTNYLQTIPANAIIAVYDANGHTSAKVAAYLRILGYDVKSILFGANTLFYSRVLWVSSLEPFAFKQTMIMNFPYVTGN